MLFMRIIFLQNYIEAGSGPEQVGRSDCFKTLEFTKIIAENKFKIL